MLSVPGRSFRKVLTILSQAQRDNGRVHQERRSAAPKPVVPVRPSGRYERQTQQDATLRQMGAAELGVQVGFKPAPAAPAEGAPPPPPPPPAPAGRGSQRSRVSASWVCWSNGGCSQLATGFPGRRTSNTSTRVPLPWAPALAAATKWSGAAAEQAGPGAAAALPGGAHRAVRCWPGGQCHSGRSAALPPPPLRMSSWHNLSLRASSAAAKER